MRSKMKSPQKQVKRTTRLGVRILDVIIVILCVIFLASVAGAISSFLEEKNYGYKAHTFQYALESGDYYRMVSYADGNRSEKFHVDDPEYIEYYAIADYYKATWHVNMYQKTGEADMEKLWREKQAEAKSKLGFYAGEAGKIEEKIGIMTE
ncbi:MAG: hypothetical protein ACI4FY_02360 [Acetatifactor sp.]